MSNANVEEMIRAKPDRSHRPLIGCALDGQLVLKRRRISSGFTLIEILIALGLSAGILVTLVYVLNTVYGNKATQKALIEVQRNGRVTIDTIFDTLYHSGFEGCLTSAPNSADTHSVVLTGATADFPIADIETESLLAFHVNDSGVLSPAAPNTQLQTVLNNLTPAPLPGTTVLVSFSLSRERTPLMTNGTLSSASDALPIAANTLNLVADDYIAVTDCNESSIVRVTDVTENAINHTGLDRSFGTGAEIRRARVDILYVGNSGRRDLLGEPVNSLFRVTNGRTVEVAEGILSLQALFQSRLPSGNIRALRADDAALDMSQVTGVRLGILVKSLGGILALPSAEGHFLLSETVAPSTFEGVTDRHLTKAFDVNLVIRNRG